MTNTEYHIDNIVKFKTGLSSDTFSIEETGTTTCHIDNIETRHSKVYNKDMDLCDLYVDYEYEEPDEEDNEG